MDHVIESMREWLRVYELDEKEEQDKEAIKCIKAAIRELKKYYA
jgi:hypothetical protein